MNQFKISPDDCLILKAFKDTESLREAAQLLNCDPAGLTRRVQFIATQYGFLQKINNRWRLTKQGLDLAAWTEASIQTQNKVLSNQTRLRLASTMWLSEELLIPQVGQLRKQLGPESEVSFSVPTQSFESSLLSGNADFVIACHPPETPEIEHRRVATEQWAVVAPANWRKDLGTLSKAFDKLLLRPHVRHSEMNFDLFFTKDHLPQKESGLLIDNLIGIRAAVCAGFGWSLVPRVLIQKDLQAGTLIEIEHELLVKDRHFCVWWLRNRVDTRVMIAKLCNWVKEIA
jgi:DNA-binding transcriptional LysR family regulator